MAFGQVLKAPESKSSPTTETNLQNFRGKKLLPLFVRMKVSSNEEGSIFVPNARCTKCPSTVLGARTVHRQETLCCVT